MCQIQLWVLTSHSSERCGEQKVWPSPSRTGAVLEFTNLFTHSLSSRTSKECGWERRCLEVSSRKEVEIGEGGRRTWLRKLHLTISRRDTRRDILYLPMFAQIWGGAAEGLNMWESFSCLDLTAFSTTSWLWYLGKDAFSYSSTTVTSPVLLW